MTRGLLDRSELPFARFTNGLKSTKLFLPRPDVFDEPAVGRQVIIHPPFFHFVPFPPLRVLPVVLVVVLQLFIGRFPPPASMYRKNSWLNGRFSRSMSRRLNGSRERSLERGRKGRRREIERWKKIYILAVEIYWLLETNALTYF